VFKALALLNLDNGKDAEAEALINHVRKSYPIDRKLLNYMVIAMDLLKKGTAQMGHVN
jgi:hypothetical protein